MSAVGGSNIVTNGLVLCLDAANPKSYSGSGTTWFDLSGNGRNFNWASTPTFTTGQQNYFNTLSNPCRGPASDSFGINNTSGYTIFLIVKELSLTNSAAFKFYSSNELDEGSENRGIFAHCTINDGGVYFDQGGCCDSNTRTFVPSGGSLTWNIWTFRRLTGSSTRSIHKNGIEIATNTATAADINLSNRAVDLGHSDDFGPVWNAQLNSFVVYNRGLSNDEIKQNYNALRGRFSL